MFVCEYLVKVGSCRKEGRKSGGRSGFVVVAYDTALALTQVSKLSRAARSGENIPHELLFVRHHY